jgi:hypothetical protein
MNKKLLVIISIILLVVILAITGIFLFSKYKLNEDNKYSQWLGKWSWKEQTDFSFSDLEITNLTQSSFYFSISTYMAPNVGDIDGSAKIINNRRAVAIIGTGSGPSENPETCIVEFNLSDSVISLKTNTSCQGFAGHGVRFDGDYIKK